MYGQNLVRHSPTRHAFPPPADARSQPYQLSIPQSCPPHSFPSLQSFPRHDAAEMDHRAPRTQNTVQQSRAIPRPDHPPSKRQFCPPHTAGPSVAGILAATALAREFKNSDIQSSSTSILDCESNTTKPTSIIRESTLTPTTGNQPTSTLSNGFFELDKLSPEHLKEMFLDEVTYIHGPANLRQEPNESFDGVEPPDMRKLAGLYIYLLSIDKTGHSPGLYGSKGIKKALGISQCPVHNRDLKTTRKLSGWPRGEYFKVWDHPRYQSLRKVGENVYRHLPHFSSIQKDYMKWLNHLDKTLGLGLDTANAERNLDIRKENRRTRNTMEKRRHRKGNEVQQMFEVVLQLPNVPTNEKINELRQLCELSGFKIKSIQRRYTEEGNDTRRDERQCENENQRSTNEHEESTCAPQEPSDTRIPEKKRKRSVDVNETSHPNEKGRRLDDGTRVADPRNGGISALSTDHSEINYISPLLGTSRSESFMSAQNQSQSTADRGRDEEVPTDMSGFKWVHQALHTNLNQPSDANSELSKAHSGLKNDKKDTTSAPSIGLTSSLTASKNVTSGNIGYGLDQSSATTFSSGLYRTTEAPPAARYDTISTTAGPFSEQGYGVSKSRSRDATLRQESSAGNANGSHEEALRRLFVGAPPDFDPTAAFNAAAAQMQETSCW
ncbi:hypothetical protein GGI35DRAFT_314067 [Trichoderma velutinum]